MSHLHFATENCARNAQQNLYLNLLPVVPYSIKLRIFHLICSPSSSNRRVSRPSQVHHAFRTGINGQFTSGVSSSSSCSARRIHPGAVSRRAHRYCCCCCCCCEPAACECSHQDLYAPLMDRPLTVVIAHIYTMRQQ